jgi:hypothetical protein
MIPATVGSLLVGVGMALVAVAVVMQPIWRGPAVLPPDDELLEARIRGARTSS